LGNKINFCSRFGFVEVNEDGSVKEAAPPKANWVLV
jgi:hypothetical protein